MTLGSGAGSSQSSNQNAQEHSPAATMRPTTDAHIGISRVLNRTGQRKTSRKTWSRATSPKMSPDTRKNAC